MATFWAFIDEARVRRERGADVASTERAATWLTRRLALLPPSVIVAFDRIYDRQFQRAKTEGLREVAALVRGWPSPDGFEYFRAWLIAQGREVFERALHDPDSLAEVIQDDAECESFLYVAMTAYETATGGKDIPRPPRSLDYEGFSMPFNQRATLEQITARIPKLCARFGAPPKAATNSLAQTRAT